jgi:hypothetical protein
VYALVTSSIIVKDDDDVVISLEKLQDVLVEFTNFMLDKLL